MLIFPGGAHATRRETRTLSEGNGNFQLTPDAVTSQAVDSNSVNAETQFFELALVAESCATLS